MQNHITIGGKIGYLNPRTGKYKYVEIVGMDGQVLKMKEERRQNNFGSSYSIFINEYEEQTVNVIQFLKTPSPDWKDGRPLLKYKGTTKN